MRLLEALLQAPAHRPLFRSREGWVCAEDVRRVARALLPELERDEGPLFVHTASVADCLAALLAAACAGRPVALPAHTRRGYLAEIGCSPDAICNFDRARRSRVQHELALACEDPVLWFYTSGSTDAPQKIAKPLSLLECEARALQSLWGADASHVLATVSHQHIYGFLFRMVWPLLSQRTSDEFAASYWEELEGRIGGATLVSSPAHLTRLPPKAVLFDKSPALVFSSGQALESNSAQAASAALGCLITEVLGSTETGGIAWRRQSAVADGGWIALPQVKVLCDEDGSLAVRSPYSGGEAAVRTGDRVRMTPEGRFYLLGRGDRVVKVEGKRVSLVRVEMALCALADIDQAVALVLPQRHGGLAAVIVLSPHGRAQLQALGPFRLTRQLRSASAALLEPAEQPKHWRFVDAIPEDSQGKRALSDLQALFVAELSEHNESDKIEAVAGGSDVGEGVIGQLRFQFKRLSEAELEASFLLAPELNYFSGHFPDVAILPGIAQLHIVALISQQLWPDWRPSGEIARLKFQRPLFPGDMLRLHLLRQNRGDRIRFTLSTGGAQVSGGELLGAR